MVGLRCFYIKCIYHPALMKEKEVYTGNLLRNLLNSSYIKVNIIFSPLSAFWVVCLIDFVSPFLRNGSTKLKTLVIQCQNHNFHCVRSYSCPKLLWCHVAFKGLLTFIDCFYFFFFTFIYSFFSLIWQLNNGIPFNLTSNRIQ